MVRGIARRTHLALLSAGAAAGTKPLLIARLRGEEPPASHQKRNAGPARGAAAGKSPAAKRNALVSLGDSGDDDDGSDKSDDDSDDDALAARPSKGVHAKRQKLFATGADSPLSESSSRSGERDECAIA